MEYNKKGNGHREIASALWPAIALGICCGGLLFLMGPVYETSDDWYLAQQLSLGYRGTFLAPWLSEAFIWLYATVHQLPWWSIFLFACGCLTLVIFLYDTFRRFSGWNRILLGCVWVAAIWICFLSKMNFTRTAFAVALSGGLLLNLAGTYDNKHKIFGFFERVIGAALLALSFMIRAQAALVAVFFLLLFTAFEVVSALQNRSGKLAQLCKKEVGRLLAIMLAAAFTVLGVTAGSDTAWEEYQNYNLVRSQVQDYAANYPAWEDASESYERLGLSENDMRLIFEQSFSEDTELLDASALTALTSMHKSLNRPIAAFGALIQQTLTSHVLGLAAAFLLFVYLSAENKTVWRRILISIAGAAGILLCFALLGRIELRVSEPVLFCILTVAFLLLKLPDKPVWKEDNGIRFICKKTVSTGEQTRTVTQQLPLKQLVALCLCAVFAFRAIWPEVTKLHIPTASDERSEEVVAKTDYFNGTRDRIYLLPMEGDQWNQVVGTWRTFPQNYCPNVFFLGGWAARSPENVQQLADNGIANPVVSLFENPNVYTTYDETVLRYVNEHYGEDITCTAVEPASWIGTVPVVKLTAPISAMHDPQGDIAYTINAFYQCGNDDIWCLQISSEEEFDRIYCNVQSEGNTYSFFLEKQADIPHYYQGFFYGLSGHLTAGASKISLIGHADGQAPVYIDDISQQLGID